MAAQNHIIKKQVIEIQLPPGYGKGREVQDKIAGLFHKDLIPAMSSLFDEIAGEDSVLRIGKLVIDLGKLPERFERRFTKRVERQLLAELQDIVVTHRLNNQLSKLGISGRDAPAESTLVSPEQTSMEILTFYLRTGHLPWNAAPQFRKNPFRYWFRELKERFPAEVSVLLRSELNSERQRQRFIHQLSDADVSETLFFIAASELRMDALRELELVLLLADQVRAIRTGRRNEKKFSFHRHRAGIWSCIISEVLTQSSSAGPAILTPDFLRKLLESAAPELKPMDKRSSEELSDSLKDLTRLSRGEAAGKIKTILRKFQQTEATEKADRLAGKRDVSESESSPDKDTENSRQSNPKNDSESRTDLLEDALSLDEYAERDSVLKLIRNIPETVTDVHIENAGLILLHPFLISYFTSEGLVRDKAFITEEAQQRAVFLLQYLATGEQECAEEKLVLNKILCGLDPSHPVVPGIQMTGNEKNACHNLLEAVISHWKVLKRTSPAALRNTFLQREGILSRESTASQWKLTVERKSHDILLNRLPWGLSVVKLPWCNNMIYVQW
jgi:hypothetical protein